MKPEIRFIEVEYHETPPVKVKIEQRKKESTEQPRRWLPLLSLSLFRTVA